MIYKSYLLEKNIELLKNKIVLFYGENLGLKDELKEKIKKKNKKVFISNLMQDDCIANKDNFISNIFNKSLFEEKKIYFINQANDKILDIIKEVNGKLEDQEIYLFSEVLEKKSKLRKFFESSKNNGVVPCYSDNEISLKNIIQIRLKEYTGLTPEIINIIFENCNFDRVRLNNEIDKIISCFIDKKIKREKLEFLLNLKTNEDFNILKDEVLNGDKVKTNSLLSETIFDPSKNIFYLNVINHRLIKLLEIYNYGEKVNYENAINMIKPPIFWKDKPIFSKQLKMWSASKVKKAMKMIFQLELKMKSNSFINQELLIKKLLLDIYLLANA